MAWRGIPAGCFGLEGSVAKRVLSDSCPAGGRGGRVGCLPENWKWGAVVFFMLAVALVCIVWKEGRKEAGALETGRWEAAGNGGQVDAGEKEDFIKWVDFGVSYDALCDAYGYDVESYGSEVHVQWIPLLAFLGAKYGGDFLDYKKKDMEYVVRQLVEDGRTMEELTENMKYYAYYLEAYGAVLGGLVGEYREEAADIRGASGAAASGMLAKAGANGEGAKEDKVLYGLRAFSPVAKDFYYTDYDDFGVSRSYGYRRQHLGHDMMGQVGTPIIAVESGTVEAMGWNQYGGWRIGIRSLDQKRYYYYAHLRKGYPYQSCLEEGSRVEAGDVIGYMGRTGYSAKEDTNNIDTPHLHFGLQLIFDESQKKESDTFTGTEIWIDCYSLIRFLYKNRCETRKVEGTKEWDRVQRTVWAE